MTDQPDRPCADPDHTEDPPPRIVDPVTGTDDRGDRWITVLAAPCGHLIAGRDLLGNYHAFATAEEVYDAAIATLNHFAAQLADQNRST